MIFKEREPLIDAQALTKPVIPEQTLEQKETKTNEEFIAGQSQLIKENKENIEEENLSSRPGVESSPAADGKVKYVIFVLVAYVFDLMIQIL